MITSSCPVILIMRFLVRLANNPAVVHVLSAEASKFLGLALLCATVFGLTRLQRVATAIALMRLSLDRYGKKTGCPLKRRRGSGPRPDHSDRPEERAGKYEI